MLSTFTHAIQPKHGILVLAIFWTIFTASFLEEAFSKQNCWMGMRISTGEEIIAFLRSFRINNSLSSAIAILIYLLYSSTDYINIRICLQKSHLLLYTVWHGYIIRIHTGNKLISCLKANIQQVI